ncbi:MAG TPA: hypothetical protein VGR64_01130 [Terracidiphilus sp.]|nr:hypothetical protein [Terracidiphilus sp.]
MPRKIVRFQLRNAFPAKKRILLSPSRGKQFRRFSVLLAGFFRPILLLLQECIARDAFRGLLLRRGMLQKAVVDGQRLGFVFGIHQQVKEHAVVHGSAIRLLAPRVQIPQRLRRFHVRRRFLEHRKVRFDSVLYAVFLKELLGAFQVLVNVCHSCGLPSRMRSACGSAGGAPARFLDYIPWAKGGQKLRAPRCGIVQRTCGSTGG